MQVNLSSMVQPYVKKSNLVSSAYGVFQQQQQKEDSAHFSGNVKGSQKPKPTPKPKPKKPKTDKGTGK